MKGDIAISTVGQIELKERLIELVEPVVQDHGAVLVDLELGGGANNQILRVLVHTDSGITLAQCEGISREVADMLDVEDPIPGRYRLEVTSPGLGRPLRSDRDFSRAHSRLLKVVLASGAAKYGRLLEWHEDRITLKLKEGAEEIERRAIVKATIEAEF